VPKIDGTPQNAELSKKLSGYIPILYYMIASRGSFFTLLDWHYF